MNDKPTMCESLFAVENITCYASRAARRRASGRASISIFSLVFFPTQSKNRPGFVDLMIAHVSTSYHLTAGSFAPPLNMRVKLGVLFDNPDLRSLNMLSELALSTLVRKKEIRVLLDLLC